MLLTLCACASSKGSWPTLALRPSEVGTLAASSQTPLPACIATLQPLPPSQPLTPLPALPLPGDALSRLTAAETTLSAIATRVPPQADRAAKARASAQKAPADEALMIAAEVEQSRLEALVLPLGGLADEFDAVEQAVAGRDGDAPVLARIASDRARAADLASQAGTSR